MGSPLSGTISLGGKHSHRASDSTSVTSERNTYMTAYVARTRDSKADRTPLSPVSSVITGKLRQWAKVWLLLGVASLGVAGCGTTVATQSGPDAANPQCAEVLAALHGSSTLASLPRQEVTGQSTAAWGDPAVIMRCGVTVPGPSTQGCLSVNDVDWAGPRDPKANDRRYVTYGRSPAVEVFIPVGSPAAPHLVLAELGPIVEKIASSKSCL